MHSLLIYLETLRNLTFINEKWNSRHPADKTIDNSNFKNGHLPVENVQK